MRVGIYVVIVLFMLTFMYSFYIAPHPKLPDSVKNLNHGCVYGCSPSTLKHLPRGSNYFIEESTPETKQKLDSCLFTAWNLSHLILYFFVTMACPEYALEFFGLGVAFEGYEWYAHGCEDIMDLFANGAGILAGLAVNKRFM